MRDRLLPVLAALPTDFFRVVAGPRGVRIELVALAPDGLHVTPPDQIHMGHGSRAFLMRTWEGEPTFWKVLLGRVAIEVYTALPFAGVVVHELAHVYLEHDVYMTTPEENEIQQMEDEAVALGCKLGFRRETEAMLNASRSLFGDDIATGQLPGDAQ